MFGFIRTGKRVSVSPPVVLPGVLFLCHPFMDESHKKYKPLDHIISSSVEKNNIHRCKGLENERNGSSKYENPLIIYSSCHAGCIRHLFS